MIDAGTILLGVEGLHAWNGLTLNDHAAWPRFVIDDITGLFGNADTDDNRAPKTEAVGELVYPSKVRGKTVGYSGTIYGRTRVEVLTARQTLIDAFGPDADGTNPERQMVVSGHAADYTGSRAFSGRVISITADDKATVSSSTAQAPGGGIAPYTIGFDIAIRMSDPRHYRWDGVTLTDPKF